MKTIIHIVPSWPSKYKKYDCIFIYDQVKNLALRSDLNFIVLVGYPIGWYVKNPKFWFLDFPMQIDLPNVKVVHFFYHNAFKVFKTTRTVVYIKIKKYFNNSYDDFSNILVHAHFTNMGAHALKLLRDFSVNYILTEHSGKFIHYQEIYKFTNLEINEIMEEAKQIVVVSQYVKNDLLNHSQINDKTKISIIPNGVDKNKFFPLNKNKKGFKLLYVGNLLEAKGVKILLDAFLKIPKESDYSLTIVGSGNLEKYCIDFIAKNGLTQKVFLLGSVNHEALNDIMNEHHVLLLPSFSESFGIVIAEALFAGIPAIATKCGGPEFIIDKPFLGKLIPIGDSNALRIAIEDVRNNYDSYNSESLRQNAIKRFSWESVATEIINKYY